VSERLLVSLRRSIASSRDAEYEDSWSRLRAAADAVGVNAWRFRGLDSPETRLEFLECAADRNPLTEPAVRDALRSLDALNPADPEEWIGG
jgi:hypothetical protein